MHRYIKPPQEIYKGMYISPWLHSSYRGRYVVSVPLFMPVSLCSFMWNNHFHQQMALDFRDCQTPVSTPNPPRRNKKNAVQKSNSFSVSLCPVTVAAHAARLTVYRLTDHFLCFCPQVDRQDEGHYECRAVKLQPSCSLQGS